MRKDVTLECLSDLALARIYLEVCQRWLRAARSSGQPRAIVAIFEKHFGKALDRVWEAQQRAA
jgi:hypothetical protein